MKTIKKLSLTFTLAFLCAFFTACGTFEVPGTYKIYKIDLLIQTKPINWDAHCGGDYEFRLEANGKATVSYIYITDHAGDRNYQAHPGSGVLDYSTSGGKLLLDGKLGLGTLDIDIYDGWIILSYEIENEVIYIAQYRKTA